MTEEEFQTRYTVHSLAGMECVTAFDCGDEDLNDFVIQEAGLYKQAMLAVTYVVEDKQHQIAAYFCLANDKVSITDFNSNSEFNRFRKHRFVQEKRLRSYPAVKLCRLGVDIECRGTGMGSFLLDFIKTLFVINNKTGCRFITVDAYKAAVPFYEKNGFLPLTSKDNNEHTKLMYYDLASNYQENIK